MMYAPFPSAHSHRSTCTHACLCTRTLRADHVQNGKTTCSGNLEQPCQKSLHALLCENPAPHSAPMLPPTCCISYAVSYADVRHSMLTYDNILCRTSDLRYSVHVLHRMLRCRMCLTYDIDMRCRTCTTYDIVGVRCRTTSYGYDVVRVQCRTCTTFDIVCNIGIIRCRTSDVRHRTSARIQKKLECNS